MVTLRLQRERRLDCDSNNKSYTTASLTRHEHRVITHYSGIVVSSLNDK